MEITKEEFLQLVKLDDSIMQLNLKIGYDGIEATGEIKFFVDKFPSNHGIYFAIDLDKNSLSYQLAKYEEKVGIVMTEVFNSATDAMIIIRDIITHFYLFTMMKEGLPL